MENAMEELKMFRKMASRNVFKIFTALAEGNTFTRGLLGRKRILNDSNLFYFSEILL